MSLVDCSFCQIVAGAKPCYKIYEDGQFLAFLDIFPKSPGHTLLIPKKHYPLVWDMTNPGELLNLGQKLVRHYQHILKTPYIYADIWGKLVTHAHLHLIPQDVYLNLSLPEIQHLLKLPTP